MYIAWRGRKLKAYIITRITVLWTVTVYTLQSVINVSAPNPKEARRGHETLLGKSSGLNFSIFSRSVPGYPNPYSLIVCSSSRRVMALLD